MRANRLGLRLTYAHIRTSLEGIYIVICLELLQKCTHNPSANDSLCLSNSGLFSMSTSFSLLCSRHGCCFGRLRKSEEFSRSQAVQFAYYKWRNGRWGLGKGGGWGWGGMGGGIVPPPATRAAPEPCWTEPWNVLIAKVAQLDCDLPVLW